MDEFIDPLREFIQFSFKLENRRLMKNDEKYWINEM